MTTSTIVPEFPRLTRKAPGWYFTRIGATVYEIVNMQGESVKYSGLGPHWITKVDGVRVDESYTLKDCKRWLTKQMMKHQAKTQDAS